VLGLLMLMMTMTVVVGVGRGPSDPGVLFARLGRRMCWAGLRWVLGGLGVRFRRLLGRGFCFC